jgi:hypothetical protein
MTVRPAPHSRRENAVSLTPAGTDLVRRGHVAFQRENTAGMPTVDPHDMQAAIRVLAAMNAALDPAAAAKSG